jgi:hypothetical protein
MVKPHKMSKPSPLPRKNPDKTNGDQKLYPLEDIKGLHLIKYLDLIG